MNYIKKWYTYQKERFPVLMYGIYIFAIVFAVFCYCNNIVPIIIKELLEILKGPTSLFYPEYNTNFFNLIPMFVVAFLQFFMVRIIDEFKDYEEDCKYRPYRPVPRGLITLKELKIAFIICAFVQFCITMSSKSGALQPWAQLFWLIVLWGYFFIMSKGYFMKKFIDKHLLFEVFLDELMMPIMCMYLASFVYDTNIKLMFPFLLMTYIVSWIVEIARKVRCKEDEEKGVKTYTALFGIKKATLMLFVLELFLCVVQVVILGKEKMIFAFVIFAIVGIIDLLFIVKQDRGFAKVTELSANIYILGVYLSMGFLL